MEAPTNDSSAACGQSALTDGLGVPGPQEGIWTLTAPDGRQWQGPTPLRCAMQESRERVPPEVALARIAAEMEPTEDERDAARYRWLRQHANNAWEVTFDDAGRHLLQGEELDASIDRVLKTPNA